MVSGPCLHKTQSKAYVDIEYGRDLCGHRIWATVNQDLPVHHPLDACYYSVVYEPQLKYLHDEEFFWLMLVEKCPRIVVKSFEDGWKNAWTEGDVVIRGYWYEKLQRFSSHTYFLRDDKLTTYVFSHLVLAYKFTMLPTVHTMKGSMVMPPPKHSPVHHYTQTFLGNFHLPILKY